MIPELEYFSPKSIKETCEFLKENGSKTFILAGGTDLLVDLRFGDNKSDKKFILNLMNLKSDLGQIEYNDGILKIGSLVTHTELSESPIILEKALILAKSALVLGSTQLRNIGTIGGNVVNASPAGDNLPSLVALGTKVIVTNLDSERKIDLEDFVLGPNIVDLKHDEFVTGFEVEAIKKNARGSFIKIGRRKSLAIARLNMAVVLEKDEDGYIKDVRICPGAILPVTKRIRKAEDIMIGEKPTAELIDKAASVVADEVIKITGIRSSSEYKIPVLESLTKRALNEVILGGSE